MKFSKPNLCLAILLCSFVYMNFGCECQREEFNRAEYSVSLLPLAADYEVGDTLVLRMEMDPMFELANDVLDNSNLPVSINFDLFEGIEGEAEVLAAREHFEYVELAGRFDDLASRGYTLDVFGDCSDTNCELAVGFIPQKAGYFGIALGVGWADVSECMATRLDPLGIENSMDNNADLFAEIGIEVTRVDDRFFIGRDSLLYFFMVSE